MTAPWTRDDAIRDASDQTAEHNDTMAAEAWDHNLWADPDDDRPSAAELADDFDWEEERHRGWTS